MYTDQRPCSVCGAPVRLEAHPGGATGAAGAGDPGVTGPVGPPDGVVGTADDGPDRRVCTDADCPSHEG